ncbi:MAG: type III pantothenate kinase [Tissierellales bacterium]|nr:type III pantothenate kinase [Tissierellales bacterium]MBN2827282.1 type III pantothenate kinase [Tissierellales bacterium]
MLLAIDIGNTNITIGVWSDGNLNGPWRMTTKQPRTSDEYGLFIKNLLEINGVNTAHLEAIIVSSVVPNIMYSFTRALEKYLGLEPIIVGPGTKTGLDIKAENPKEVGADRIVDAVAAYEIYGGPIIVIDFGTATTYDVVSEKFEFIAAITSPGIQISADALWSRSAQLPNIAIRKPRSIMARNTITSMQAGLVYGYIGQVEYIVQKIKEEMDNFNVKVVATGGLGSIIFPETKVIDEYDILLTLKGLKIIYEKNFKG